MIYPAIFWLGSVAAFTAAFAFILWKEWDARFLLYAVFGSATAFILFDFPSASLGFYGYAAEYYESSLLGIPLSMTIAEGMCIAIAIYAFEKAPAVLRKLKLKK